MYVCMYVCVCVCMYVCMYVNLYTYVYTYATVMYVYTYVCMYVCMYVCIYGKSVCMYIYTGRAHVDVVHIHILSYTHTTTHAGNWNVTHWTHAERTCVDVSSSMLAIARSKVLTLLALLVQKYKFMLTPEAQRPYTARTRSRRRWRRCRGRQVA
jgi:hypothetical protein